MSAPTLYKAGEQVRATVDGKETNLMKNMQDFEVEGVIAFDDVPDGDSPSKHVQVSIKRMRQFDRHTRRPGLWVTASGRVSVRRETVKPRPDQEMQT